MTHCQDWTLHRQLALSRVAAAAAAAGAVSAADESEGHDMTHMSGEQTAAEGVLQHGVGLPHQQHVLLDSAVAAAPAGANDAACG